VPIGAVQQCGECEGMYCGWCSDQEKKGNKVMAAEDKTH
jgi:hypothetical protein